MSLMVPGNYFDIAADVKHFQAVQSPLVEDRPEVCRSRASGAEAQFDEMIRSMEAKYAIPAKSKKRKVG